MSSNKISFAIGIPTINQAPLLNEFLDLYNRDFPDTLLIIIDNGKQSIQRKINQSIEINNPESSGVLFVTHNTTNIGVAASWNLICKKIFDSGHTHAIIPNDDVYWGHNAERMNYLLSTYPRDFYKTSHDNWCFFVISKTTYQKVGPFNEAFFPAYFEDRDYFRRMKLAGCSVFESVWFDPQIMHESQSIKKDNSLLDNFDKNEQLYIDMWGGKPGFEKYDLPFNGKKKIVWQADGTWSIVPCDAPLTVR